MSKREMTDSLERPGFLKEVKVVLVGPAKCGKTALIQRFVNDIYSDNYVPTGFEKYSTKTKIGDYTIEYSIWDTSGSGSYDTVRPLAYQDANVFILCFNISEPESLELAIKKWLPEIRLHSTNLIPIILCGCKADIRHNNTIDTTLYMNQLCGITYEKAFITCQHINASGYIETCSKYPNTAINEVFKIAAESALGISDIQHHNNNNHKKLSKNAIKKRKMYSITSSSSSATSTSSSTTPTNRQIIKNLTLSSSSSQSTNNATNGKPHIKSEIRKSTKNCSIM